MAKKTTDTTVEEKLDEIILHLRAMDHRDKLRTIGGFFRGLISLIPVIVLLASVWYAYYHGEEFIKMISEQAAKQAQLMMENSVGGFLGR